MKKHTTYMIALAVALTALSAALYYLQINLFRTPRDTFFYLLQDLAFVPVQLLIVTVIIERILSVREKRAMMEKMNMAIGVFFSEIGTELLKSFAEHGALGDSHRKELSSVKDWNGADFKRAARSSAKADFSIERFETELEGLKGFLHDKKDFLLTLLQNPNLMEHDSFTELLRSVFHVFDELEGRKSLTGLGEADLKHLEGDLKRAYGFLITEWVLYMKYLKKSYPYLFSIAARKNPFDPGATVEIKG
ncbi:MAG: hypothetical protein HY955_06360 [Deltaproteobacteria bacterium]|nr:hypothetical protein [Deltaproteobacteria bacterium]